MEVGQDARTDHHLLMSELRDAVAQVHCSPLPVNAEALVTALQLALSDGLRCPDDGFWPAVSVAVHSETRRLVESTASPRRRGRAWLRLALSESSLGAHLRLLSREARVRRAYAAGAIFTSRGPQVAALCDRLPDLSLLLSAEFEVDGSSSSSLASPGDSGVALMDSDLDATSLHGLRDMDDWEDRCHDERNEPVVVVQRRPKRNKCKAKRVSFHDDPTPESMEPNTCQGERGDPEGQEDPSRQCPASLISSSARVDGSRVDEARIHGSRVDEARIDGGGVDGDRVDGSRVDGGRVDGGKTSDARQKCRLNCRSIPTRWGLAPRPSVYIKTSSRDRQGDVALHAMLASTLASRRRPRENPAGDFSKLLGPKESVYKVFRVHCCPLEGEKRSSLIGPVLAVLTNHRLCLAAPGLANHAALDYQQLSALLVCAGQQGLLLAAEPDVRLLLATGDEQLTNELASSISLATLKATRRGLPTGHVTLEAMTTVLGKTITLHQGERLVHVSRVQLHGDGDVPASPLGPALRGPLMVSLATLGQGWTPRHIALKAGVLYEFECEASALPLRCHALAQMQRCQRDAASPRPHAFLLRWTNQELRLAAADDQQASHWLTCIAAAAHMQEWEEPVAGPAPRCLALTNRGRLFAVDDAMSTNEQQLAEVDALSAVRRATLHADLHCCQLEWACREARQESSDDWLLHFASANQMQAFLDALAGQWEQRCQAVALPLAEMRSATLDRCVQAKRLLDAVWD